MRNAQFTNFEWFMQDNWRVGKNLTIDAGIRFYYVGPTKSRGDQLAVFQPDQFDPAQAPMLIQPTTRRRPAPRPQPADRRDPAGGEDRHLRAQLGRSRTTASRSSTKASSTRRRFRWRRASASPGMSTGDGRTAVRGGFGLFPDRFNDDIILQLVELPPLVNTYTANYTTIRDLLATPLSQSPANTRYLDHRLQAAVHLQLQPRRAARSRLEAGRRHRVCRVEGAPPAADRTT